MKKRPNILWISFEDTNPFYGCYGDSVARTPNVDQLAADGCRWPNAFSTAGVCAPARSAIITGMYAISIGTHHMRTTHVNDEFPEMPTPYLAVIPPEVKCFSEYLRAAGYFCTNNKKTDYQFEPPITAWNELGSQAHWRNRPDPEQPFFAVFNIESTHESGMWPKPDESLAFDPTDVELPPYLPDTPKSREAMARMHTNIASNDQRLGLLLRQLEEDGLADHTIVFHWSDHGPLPRGKRWPYDSGIHVPMIVRWPGHFEPGTVREELVSTVDLAPTVLSLAGLDIPHHLQGQAFLGDGVREPREYVFATRDRHDCTYDRVRAVRDRRFKYIRNYYPHTGRSAWNSYLHRHPIMQELWRLHLSGELTPLQESVFFSKMRPVEELYDLESDPHETVNLAADCAFSKDKTRLCRVLDSWLDEVGDMGAIPETEMVRRWYPDGVMPVTASPVAVCVDTNHLGIDACQPGEVYTAPARLILQTSTQGASIAYRFKDDAPECWRLYDGPIALDEGVHELTAKAIRIGYRESPELVVRLEVDAG